MVVHGSPECIRTLKEHVFNEQLWPDFTAIPSAEQPVLRLEPFELGKTLKIGDFTIRSIPVCHPVESVGYLVEKGKSIIAMSGDTGPTDDIWTALRNVRNLKGVLLETSFPNALQRLAEQSGHLTPQTMSDELDRASFLKRNGVPVLLQSPESRPSRASSAPGGRGHRGHWRVRILELGRKSSVSRREGSNSGMSAALERLLLRDLPFFAQLRPDELVRVASRFRCASLTTGESLLLC